MIQNFRCSDTESLFKGRRVARFVNVESVALRKLQQLHAATALDFLRVPPGTAWRHCQAIDKASTAFASMTNGACASHGETDMRMTLKLWTTTEGPNHDT